MRPVPVLCVATLLGGLLPLWAQTCSYSVNPTIIPMADEGGTGTVTVFASPASCQWTAVANVPWLTISFGGVPGNPSSGNGTVGFRAAANREAAIRSGTMTIAGQTVTVRQEGANCAFTLNPPSAIVTPGGASGSFAVQTTCSWTATSNVEWITLSAPVSGTGSGSVRYTASANSTTSTRSGSISVGSARFTVSQPAAACTVTVAPASANVAATGGSGTVQVTSPCSWTAVSSAPWLRLSNGAGPGNGSFQYSADPNPTAAARSAVITVNGTATVKVTQAGSTCAISLSPQSASVPASGGRGSIAVTANCEWTATSSDNWLSVTGATGTGNGAVTWEASQNPAAQPRTGSIRVGTQIFTLSQAAASCPVTISPNSAAVPSAGGTGVILVSAPNCQWESAGVTDWINLDPPSGAGPVVLRWRVSANASGAERTATVSVGGQPFVFRQEAPRPVVSGLVNAASYAANALAPGLLVTIFGRELGPDDLVTYELSADGSRFTDRLGGVRVLFDGVPSPMVYSSATQVSAIVPFSVAGGQTAMLEVEARGTRTQPMRIPISEVSPGIFSIDSSGRGQGAILNQDFSINSSANPAAAGSVIQIFATGGGAMQPAVTDGAVAGTALSRTVALPVVEIGGRPAELLYSGSAPGLVAGVIQINARVPAGLEGAGEVPVVVRFDGSESQAGITVAVR